MSIMRIFAFLSACILLTGCLDVDLTLDVSDGENMVVATDLSMSRQLYDMMSKGPDGACPDGQSTLSEDSFHCVKSTNEPIADILARGGRLGADGDFDPADTVRIERLDAGSLRVTMDFAELFANQQDKPEDLAGMEGMLRAAIAGHSLIFHVRGVRILESTGTVSEDRTTATRVVPLVTFLDKDPDFGGVFVTDVALRKRCRLWLFCD